MGRLLGAIVTQTGPPVQDRGRVVFVIALVIGLGVRLGILSQTGSLGTEIVDEQHYRQIAENLIAGNGYAQGPGMLTSMRPPLYSALLASVWTVVGGVDLQAVRIVQIVLALVTVAAVYQMGVMVFGRSTGRMAAATFWLYPSFIFFNFLILTETLFTLLLMTFVYFSVRLVKSPSWFVAAACGVALGLATLTRSVLWPLPLVLCPLLAVAIGGSWRHRLTMPIIVLIGYSTIVVPWAVRNTRLQGVVTVVDTMGGLNLRMGNYEYTPEDRMWDAATIEGPTSWSFALRQEHPTGSFTDGEKDKWAQRKAVEYILANPATTVRRSLIKFSDFWGLEREFVAGVGKGMFHPPRWFTFLVGVSMNIAFVATLLLGIFGLTAASRPQWREHLFLLLPVVAIMFVHMAAFGHSRYHLPVMPILGIYAATVCVSGGFLRGVSRAQMFAAAAVSASFAAIWIRQVLVVDGERLRAFIERVS